MTPRIERMRPEHVAQVAQLDTLCFAVPWSKKSFENEMANNLACYHVLLVGEKVIGYGGYWHVLNEAHVTNIAVLPAYRRKGCGSMLLAHMILDARKNGADTMTLEVRISNHAARALYERYGFCQTGLRPGYYSDNREDALIMTKQWEMP